MRGIVLARGIMRIKRMLFPFRVLDRWGRSLGDVGCCLQSEVILDDALQICVLVLGGGWLLILIIWLVMLRALEVPPCQKGPKVLWTAQCLIEFIVLLSLSRSNFVDTCLQGFFRKERISFHGTLRTDYHLTYNDSILQGHRILYEWQTWIFTLGLPHHLIFLKDLLCIIFISSSLSLWGPAPSTQRVNSSLILV